MTMLAWAEEHGYSLEDQFDDGQECFAPCDFVEFLVHGQTVASVRQKLGANRLVEITPIDNGWVRIVANYPDPEEFDSAAWRPAVLRRELGVSYDCFHSGAYSISDERESRLHRDNCLSYEQDVDNYLMLESGRVAQMR